jgi:hypothetical protein
VREGEYLRGRGGAGRGRGRWLAITQTAAFFFWTGCELHYEQAVMEVNEDAGEVELLRISKYGETELPVKIYITGSMCTKNKCTCVCACVCTCVCCHRLAT